MVSMMESLDGHILTIIPKPGVCARCGHFPCPGCQTWCDVCLDFDDEPVTGPSAACCEEMECLYEPGEAAKNRVFFDALAEVWAALRAQGDDLGSSGHDDEGRMTVYSRALEDDAWQREHPEEEPEDEKVLRERFSAREIAAYEEARWDLFTFAGVPIYANEADGRRAAVLETIAQCDNGASWLLDVLLVRRIPAQENKGKTKESEDLKSRLPESRKKFRMA